MTGSPQITKKKVSQIDFFFNEVTKDKHLIF